MGKAQKWLEVEPSTQTGFQKKYSGISGQKLHKKKISKTLFLSRHCFINFFHDCIVATVIVILCKIFTLNLTFQFT